jgi:hypothetical protein
MLASNDCLTCGNVNNDGFRRDDTLVRAPIKAIGVMVVSREEYSIEGNENNDAEDDMMLSEIQ